MTKVLEIKPESVVLDDQRLLPPRVVEVVPGPHAKNDTSFPILHVRDVQLNEAEQSDKNEPRVLNPAEVTLAPAETDSSGGMMPTLEMGDKATNMNINGTTVWGLSAPSSHSHPLPRFGGAGGKSYLSWCMGWCTVVLAGFLFAQVMREIYKNNGVMNFYAKLDIPLLQDDEIIVVSV